MKSSHPTYQEQRNNCSILLSQLRRNLSADQFQFFLRLQWAADRAVRERDLSPDFFATWLCLVRACLQATFHELDNGRYPREQVSLLIHYYGHLFR
jgi:hypothetical protein